MFDTDFAGPLDQPAQLERWEVDTSAGTVARTVIDARPQEFPRVAASTFGQPARYTYTVGAGSGSAFAALGLGNAVIRHDRLSGSNSEWSAGAHRSAGETVFVADPDRASNEDGGWLLCFVYDATTATSSFVVLDSEHIETGPIVYLVTGFWGASK